VNAFDNDPAKRPEQDKGLDGMTNAEETERYTSTFLGKCWWLYVARSFSKVSGRSVFR
jgi:hypothetical protein